MSLLTDARRARHSPAACRAMIQRPNPQCLGIHGSCNGCVLFVLMQRHGSADVGLDPKDVPCFPASLSIGLMDILPVLYSWLFFCFGKVVEGQNEQDLF